MFRGSSGGRADVTVRCRLPRWGWALRRAGSGPRRPLRAPEEAVSKATRHRRDKSQILLCGEDDYSQCHHVNLCTSPLFVFQVPGLSAIYVDC